MGVVCGIGAAIASAISAVTAAITTVIVTIATTVALIAAKIAVAVSFFVSEVVAPVAGAFVDAVAAAAGEIADVVNTIGNFVADKTLDAVKYVDKLYTKFDKFLTEIHFKTIMAVNSLALTVSKEYRELWKQLWGEVAKASKVLFGTAEFLHTILLNTRTIMFDMNSSLGKNFDSCDLAWMEYNNRILNRVVSLSEKYKDHPEKLVEDIDDLMIKPLTDLKASFIAGVVQTVEGNSQVLTAINNSVNTTKTAFDNMLSSLPQSIKNVAGEEIAKVDTKVNDFINLQYTPTYKASELALEYLKKENNDKTIVLKTVNDLIHNPGDLIKQIEALPIMERIRQQNVLIAMTVKPFEDDANTTIAIVNDELNRIGKELTVKIEEPKAQAWQNPAPEASNRRLPGAIEKRSTWLIQDI